MVDVAEEKLIVVNELNIDEPVKSSQVKTILADLGLNTALFCYLRTIIT